MKKLFLLLMFILCLYLTSAAENSFIFEQDKDIDLKVSCIDSNYSLCVSTTNCTITVLYPNNTKLIKSENMSFSTSYFNYTLNSTQTNSLGDYYTSVQCKGITENGFTSFIFSITPNGEELSVGKAIFYVALFLVLIILLVLSITQISVKDNYGWIIGLLCFSYILIIGILYIGWQMADNFLTSIPLMAIVFYILWLVSMYCFFPFVIMLIFILTIETATQKKIDQLVKVGHSREEAEKIAKKKR